MTSIMMKLSLVNELRSERWHAGKSFTILELAGAMCGEAGEAANIAKKIRRVELGIPGIQGSMEELIDELAKEMADTIIYMDQMARRYGINLEEVVKFVFNKKSEVMGFPERIP